MMTFLLAGGEVEDRDIDHPLPATVEMRFYADQDTEDYEAAGFELVANRDRVVSQDGTVPMMIYKEVCRHSVSHDGGDDA